MPGWRTCLPAGRMAKTPYKCMHYVYAIKSTRRNYLYVGITDNIDRRIYEHNTGKNKTTRAYRPFVLFHTETYTTRAEARQREKFLKTGYGKELLKSL
jgi:putative endonuclease